MIARKYLAGSPYRSKVRWVEQLSYDAAPVVPDDLDFLFIDGDHSLQGIERDWTAWSGKLAMGGIVALHDTRVPPHNPRVADLGSHRYFESHIRHDHRFELVEQVDSLSIMRRTPTRGG